MLTMKFVILLFMLGSFATGFPDQWQAVEKHQEEEEEEKTPPCSYLQKLRARDRGSEKRRLGRRKRSRSSGSTSESEDDSHGSNDDTSNTSNAITCGGPNGSPRPTLTPIDLDAFLGFAQIYQSNPGLLFYDLSLNDFDPWTNWYLEPDLRKQIAKLSVQRVILEKYNLWDTYVPGSEPFVDCSTAGINTNHRQADGTCTDLTVGHMGAAGTRFGRNILPIGPATQVNQATLLTPNPREVSRKLLARAPETPPKEVDFLNLLGTAWIQFQTHDWFAHETSTGVGDGEYSIPLEADDPFRLEEGLETLRVRKTRQDNGPTFGNPAFRNDVTHWWDASQIYGSDAATVHRLRSGQGGKLSIGRDGLLPKSSLDGFDDTGFRDNWWVGLGILHTLFAKEHNSIADHLAHAYPTWDDEELFQRARLINAALIVKIHTIEWTPAILPSLEVGMNINWGGLNQYLDPPLPQEFIDANIPQLASVMNGLAGSPRDLKVYPTAAELVAAGVDEPTAAYIASTLAGDVPFSLTEEFVSVYRMHPLLPDEIQLHDAPRQRERRRSVPLERSLDADARKLMERVGVENLLYSFGVEKSHQLVLQNYPKALQNLDVPGLGKLDLGTIDLLRDRERGIPRYNEFRRQLRLQPIGSIDELTDDVTLRAEIKAVYGGDNIEEVDALVGFLVESTRPTCFGFGETLFQVFIVMATRRIQGDRFYTDDFTPESYTPEGMEWVQNTSLKDVLLRHYPRLAETGLADVTNAFYPWEKPERRRRKETKDDKES